MRRLVSLLGMPQHRFASVHVVGTNGKSSVTAMVAALLEAHGRAAGAYLSPHAERWSQRVIVRRSEIGREPFARAVERVAEAVPVVNRALEEGDFVTQFEAATAVAFVALAQARVEFGVIEAGLGGRLDATNVLPSRVTVLTSIGLEHTQWLGDTEELIAAEKLAVLRDHTTLVAGELPPGVDALARRTAAERHARLVRPGELPGDLELAVPGPYARRNFAVALAAAREALGRELEPERVREVARAVRLPGRMQLTGGNPPLLLDAAHNPDGARALAEALPDVAAGRPVYACLAILADKDAAGILAALAPALAGAVCTRIPPRDLRGVGRPGTESHEPGELAALAREAGIARVEAEHEPASALARALALAASEGGVALAAGSHYLLRYARRRRG